MTEEEVWLRLWSRVFNSSNPSFNTELLVKGFQMIPQEGDSCEYLRFLSFSIILQPKLRLLGYTSRLWPHLRLDWPILNLRRGSSHHGTCETPTSDRQPWGSWTLDSENKDFPLNPSCTVVGNIRQWLRKFNKCKCERWSQMHYVYSLVMRQISREGSEVYGQERFVVDAKKGGKYGE